MTLSNYLYSVLAVALVTWGGESIPESLWGQIFKRKLCKFNLGWILL